MESFRFFSEPERERVEKQTLWQGMEARAFTDNMLPFVTHCR